MVVVAIIGIMAGALILSSGLGSEERIQEREAYRLSGLLGLLREEALMQNRDFALELTESGYRFLQYDYVQLRWIPPINERLFVDYTLPDERLSVELVLEGRYIPLESAFEEAPEDDAAPEPQLLVLSSGELTPFELGFRFADTQGRYRLTAEIDGTVEVTREGFNER
jgi:general secretion pathway protein H